MRFRTLESRIITLFLVLVLLVQLGGFLVIRNGIINNAQASTREQLKLGENLFNRLLDQKKQRLTDSARVLAKDTGFRCETQWVDKEWAFAESLLVAE